MFQGQKRKVVLFAGEGEEGWEDKRGFKRGRSPIPFKRALQGEYILCKERRHYSS